ncbi:MAG: hypothetical protein ACOY3Z_00780 [Thermodesulfobacteriota bacterium]
MTDHDHLLSEELLMVRHSGEIPEIAFHSSIHFLTADPDGPGLTLTEADLAMLRRQVVERYHEIILRDLDPENRDKSIYRGVRRTIFNWQRLGKFCGREALAVEEELRREIAAALLAFLRQETAEVLAGKRQSCINCTSGELAAFARSLGIDPETLPAGLTGICCKAGER